MGKPTFSYDIGYAGYVSIDGQAILATGGSLSVQYTPLYTSGVWGAGWYNVSQKVAYAPNYVTLSSNVNYQLTTDITGTLSDWAFEKRNSAKQYKILPNGKAGYSGSAYCIGCSFNASQDSLVTGDINLKTGHVQGTISTQSLPANSKNGAGPGLTTISNNYLSVFPFWASGVYLKNATSSTTRSSPDAFSGSSYLQQAIDWNASYSSDLVFVMTCCGSKDDLNNNSGVLQAKYCCLGAMDASGSFTIFKVSSHLQPGQIRKARNAYFVMRDSAGSNECGIKFGSIIFDSGSTDIQTGTSFIQSSFNFTALGSGITPPMLFGKINK